MGPTDGWPTAFAGWPFCVANLADSLGVNRTDLNILVDRVPNAGIVGDLYRRCTLNSVLGIRTSELDWTSCKVIQDNWLRRLSRHYSAHGVDMLGRCYCMFNQCNGGHLELLLI
jgi:hypothetical protein